MSESIKPNHKNKKKNIAILVLVLMFVLGAGGFVLSKSPRVRMLLSVVHFSETTLKSPEYLLYNIDIMELFRDYGNGDVQIGGKAGLVNIDGVAASISVDLDAARSFNQRRMAMDSTLKVLAATAGDIQFYGEDETVYLVAPLLGDFGYAFPTGIDLFMKMPELTSDINRKWFHDNSANIVKLMTQISMKDTGETLEDADGTKSEKFVVTIPEGCGHFIWELLGMEDPDYDVVVSMYLTEKNHLRRMEMDMSDVIDGMSMAIDGEKVGTCVMTYELPDEEQAQLTLVRNPKSKRWIDMTGTYTTNTGETYTITAQITWEEAEKGFAMDLKKLVFSRDEETLAEGYFKGNVVPAKKLPDVFGGQAAYLYSLQELDWREIREDTSSFVQRVLDKL